MQYAHKTQLNMKAFLCAGVLVFGFNYLQSSEKIRDVGSLRHCVSWKNAHKIGRVTAAMPALYWFSRIWNTWINTNNNVFDRTSSFKLAVNLMCVAAGLKKDSVALNSASLIGSVGSLGFNLSATVTGIDPLRAFFVANDVTQIVLSGHNLYESYKKSSKHKEHEQKKYKKESL